MSERPNLTSARRVLTILVSGLVAAFTVVVCGCDRGSPTSPTPPDALDSAFAQARLEPNIRHLVAARGGAVVRAQYFNGGAPDSQEYVWSVTKSVLALAVGAALEVGCLRSLDQTLGELLGPVMVTDPAKAGITLRHLLTMSSGIDFPADSPASRVISYCLAGDSSEISSLILSSRSGVGGERSNDSNAGFDSGAASANARCTAESNGA